MAESQAVLDIFNVALIRIGNPPVVLASQSPECQTIYPDTRDFMLNQYPWPFAIVRQQLNALTDPPLVGIGRNQDSFRFQYQMPTDPFPLRVLDIDTTRLRYRRETYVPKSTPTTQIPVIMTDAPGVVCRYVARVSEALWSPIFASVVALRLALVIAERNAAKQNLFNRLNADYQEALRMAKDVEGHQDSPTVAKFNNTYLDVRGVGTHNNLYPYLQDFEETL